MTSSVFYPLIGWNRIRPSFGRVEQSRIEHSDRVSCEGTSFVCLAEMRTAHEKISETTARTHNYEHRVKWKI